MKIQRFQCNMLRENCYVVSDESHECVIIDCGAYYEEERQAINDYIARQQLKPHRLLSTHGHIDHNWGNAMLYRAYGLHPEIHANDGQLLNNIVLQAKEMFQIDVQEKFPPIGRFFEENERIVFGTHTLQVIETPGHTQGGVCFYCEAEQVLFSGDTLFKGSIGRTDLDGGSMFQMIQSLRLLAQLPDTVKVFPGHGEATTMGLEVAGNPYMDR